MHSDSNHPQTVFGLYECPECGHEQRRPIPTGEPAA
jgi:hypothetical protein